MTEVSQWDTKEYLKTDEEKREYLRALAEDTSDILETLQLIRNVVPSDLDTIETIQEIERLGFKLNLKLSIKEEV